MITTIKNINIYIADNLNEPKMDNVVEFIYGFKIPMNIHSKVQPNIGSFFTRNIMVNYFKKSLLDNMK